MRNFKKKLLIFILLLLSYTHTNAEIIKIPPIVIESQSKQENRVDETMDILSNLKKAISKNQKSHKVSKEEEAKEILERLRESIPTPVHSSSKKTKKSTTAKQVLKRQIHNKPKRKINKKSKVKPTKKVVKRKPIKKKIVQKKIKIQKPSIQSTEPIGFVKTLGIVKTSGTYEVNDMSMDKLEDVSNDGVVDISTATTDELQELPFVKPLEIVEVTQPFEASEAKKYQLDKR